MFDQILALVKEHFSTNPQIAAAMYPLHQPHLAYLTISSELCDYGTQQYNAGAGNASPYSSM